MGETPDPEAWGVQLGYLDVRKEWVPSSETGIQAALAGMDANDWAPPSTSTWVVSRNWGLHVPFHADLVTEDGGRETVSGHVPREALPLGYHWLEPADGSQRIRLIVSPGVCPLPRRMWGWAVQLYAARSEQSWGIGDFGDLRRIAGWSSARLGGGMLLTNPLHSVAPTTSQQASPYAPASRRWRNPIFLRIEEVPGVDTIPKRTLDKLVRAGRALNRDRRINRDEVWRLKRSALQTIWSSAREGFPEFDRWADEHGAGLVGFATWSSLAEAHGPDWRTWPEELQHNDSAAVAAWAEAHADDIRFYSWLQWLIVQQLGAASGVGPALVTDLAIGADPGGADAWQWREIYASGVTIGAPPDEFNPDGQDWGLPPFDPWRLREVAYAPFTDVLRSAFAGGGGARIDHVAGLFRQFWVPAAGGPPVGAYVRFPWEDLLNVLALEADRAGAFVVGEDLGTVEPEAREALANRQILSYRLVCFEDRPPAEWPKLALGAVNTHDLPTVSGLWTGADARARRKLGLPVDDEAIEEMLGRLARLAGGPTPDTAACDVTARVYEKVSAGAALVVVGTLDDALEVDERPNHPGSTDEWPNWSLALPETLDEVETDPRVRRAAAALASGGR